MTSDPQLFRVNLDSKQSSRVQEVDFSQLGLKERKDIQEWVAANPSILGEDLLVISKEFDKFDKTKERLDLLAVDREGKLVIIELKRDDTGPDVHWQAIKYASYLQNANATHIVEMLQKHANVSEEEATNDLLEHLGADDLNGLNNDQRIILACHRFAAEVTTAALWLNHKSACENLISCVTLTPYRDAETNSLYVQSTTIIPVPGVDKYLVGIGSGSQAVARLSSSTLGEKLRKRFQQNAADDVTRFARQVATLVRDGLSGDVRPNRVGRWAGGWEHFRYFNLWYSAPPWGNHSLCYSFTLRPQEGSDSWLVYVRYKDEKGTYAAALKDLKLQEGQILDQEGIVVRIGIDSLNDGFAHRIAEVLRRFISTLTPAVNQLQSEANDEGNEEET